MNSYSSQQSMGRKVNMSSILLFLIFFFSSMMVIQIDEKSIFMWLEVVFLIHVILMKKKILRVKAPHLNAIYISLLITCLFSLVSSISVNYKRASIRNTITFLLSYVIIAYINNLNLDRAIVVYKRLGKAIIMMCNLQCMWCIIQFLLYRLYLVDINNWIFHESLGMLDIASAYKFGELLPSGLTWHPGVMAPIIAIAFFLNTSIAWKYIALLAGVLTGNATCLIATAICIGFELIIFLLDKKVSRKKFVILIFLIILVVILSIVTGFYNTIYDSITYVVQRIFGITDTNSTNAHIMYFTEYPNIVRHSSFLQVMFGYGKGASGYPFSILYYFQTYAKSWSVECDVMDILVSRGIVGFGIYYIFLIENMLKGRKVNIKYLFLQLTILLEGITYQVQYDWVFLIEALLFCMIKDGYDIFLGRLKEEKLIG